MSLTDKLRAACLRYWKHRDQADETSIRYARDRLHQVAEAYRAGWTLAMVTAVDDEAKAEAFD